MSHLQLLLVNIIVFLYILIKPNELVNAAEVDCPYPATNCLDQTFNVVIQNLGCLGCQTGCQPGYMMTANPKYLVTEGDIVGTYDYMGITLPKSKNVSEPQWLCIKGDTCPWGYFLDKNGITESCAYCGEGCRSCQSYDNCNDCLFGYRRVSKTLPGGHQAFVCVSSEILCPVPPSHCQHVTYVIAMIGCQGCIICEDGYLPTYNPNYRRQNATATYKYHGLQIAGSLEITEPRYTCVQGTVCPTGWHNVTISDVTTCEGDDDDKISKQPRQHCH